MKFNTMKSWFARVGTVAVIGTGFGVLGGLGGYVAMSYAAGLNLGAANDYQIPYQGMLELGGVPVDGPKEFVFTLYTSETSEDENDIVWISNPRTLQVSRGYFATVLGDETDAGNRIAAAVFAEPVLYIGMKVDGVELSGRQRILAVPYAQNGMPGKTFVVDGKIQTVDLEVTRNAVVAGTLRANGKVTANNGLEVTGARTELKNGLSVTGATTLNSTLGVTGLTTATGGLRVDGNVTAGGTEAANKLVQIRYYAGSADTGFSVDDWDCITAGVRFTGDIQEAGSGTIMAAYTFRFLGRWHVASSFRTHNTNGPYNVAVACFSKKISNIGSTWF